MDYKQKYLKYKNKYLNLKGGCSGSGCVAFPNVNACLFTEEGLPIIGSICPGRSILLERPTILFNINTSIYLILGHGCDLMQENIVPPNCTYITRSICGVSSGTDQKLMGLLRNFSINSSIINTPEQEILSKNHNDEETMQHMKIHSVGEKYINSKNWGVFEMQMPCGLYRIGKNLVNFDDDGDLALNGPQQIGTLLEYLSNHYEESLFPTKEDVKEVLNTIFNKEELDIIVDDKTTKFLQRYFDIFKDAIKDKFSIDFSTLMEKFPGIHYNITCRPVCKGKYTEQDLDAESPRVELIRNRYPNSKP